MLHSCGKRLMIDPNAATQDGSDGNAAVGQKNQWPSQIGGYSVLELLGQGGMGRVLLAESETPKRKVAIKLMLSGGLDSEALARFRREMDAMARIEHPGIARLYEVGTLTQDGSEQPWYAMEYVQGLPLDAYVQRNKLSIAETLKLMLQVCRSMQFAHQRGVIHRDLKPSNILVDSSGQTKILDFGIARLRDTGESAQTRFGQIIGTLAYMSPEQLSASQTADFRSDVYALGVVLYELLSGALPYKISTTSLLDAIKELSEGRRKPLHEQKPELRGEIELLVDTASHRDIELRYSSPGAFADDIERFLSHRPLDAKAPSLRYVFGKFVRRNPMLVAALSLALLSLITATGYSLWSAQRARAAEALALLARAQAEAREKTVSAMNAFLVEDLLNAGSERSDMARANITLSDAIDVAAKKLPERFQDEPQTQASMLAVMGIGLNQQGKFEQARGYFLRAAKLRANAITSSNQADALKLSEQQFEAEIDAAYALSQMGDLSKAMSELEATAKAADALLPSPHRTQARAYSYLALVAFMQEKHEQAVRFGERGLQLVDTAADVADELKSSTRLNLARALRSAERLAEAETLFVSVLNERRVREGADSGAVAESLNDVGGIYRAQGKNQQAVDSYLALIALLERTHSRNGLAFASANNNMGKAYAAMQRGSEAVAAFDAALKFLAQADDPKNPNPTSQMGIAVTLGNRARSLLALGKKADAKVDLLKADAIFAQIAPTHPARAPVTQALQGF
jgi:eukaryotic-like serine/threonine-protein kinase